jgi:broad specificity phosphatase PhoE
MRLLLLRHAEAVGNAAGQLLGCEDPPLAPTGFQQASQLALTLAQGHLPDVILSSSLRRAQQTADLLAPPSVPRLIWPELNEVPLGCLSGLTWSEAQAHYPDLCARLEQTLDYQPIPGAESPQATRQRAKACWQRIQQIQANHLWLVSHGGFLQHLVSVILGSSLSWGLSIPPLALFEFEYQIPPLDAPQLECYNTARWRIHRFNQLLLNPTDPPNRPGSLQAVL